MDDLHISPRVRPLRGARDAVERVAAGLGMAGADARVDARERLVTYEGEYAALATVAGRSPVGPVEIAVGIVLGDDFYLQIVGVARRDRPLARCAAQVRERVLHSRLGLAPVRARRFPYAPPPGWQAVERGGAVAWVPLAFPSDPGLIAVHPAQPVASLSRPTLLRRLAGAASFAVDVAPRSDHWFRTPRGLVGTASTLSLRSAPARVLEVVDVRDSQFAYPVRLESDAEHLGAHRRILEQVVDSIEPVSRPWARQVTCDALLHWAA
jgi:hypothetical protein